MDKKSILLVDDAAFMRMMCRDILEKNGYEIAGEAQNGMEAVEVYKYTKPDLVILNIVMPFMDGIEALRKIKEADGTAKAVMLSAMGQAKMVTEALMAGALDFIVKPFHPEKFLHGAASALKWPKTFNPGVLKEIHERSINNNDILMQTEIDELIHVASAAGTAVEIELFINSLNRGTVLDTHSGGEPESKAAGSAGTIRQGGPPYVISDSTPIGEAPSGRDTEIVKALNKIAEGQQDIKALLQKLVERN